MSIMVNDLQMAVVLQKVFHEIKMGSLAHPNYPDDPLRRVTLIVEEVGEAVKEALDLTRTLRYPPTLDTLDMHLQADTANRERLRLEVIQTVAMGLKMLTAMELEDAQDPKP